MVTQLRLGQPLERRTRLRNLTPVQKDDQGKNAGSREFYAHGKLLGTYQARWVNWESTEQATTSALIARNSSTLSLNARISVGQTNVLSWKKNGDISLMSILPDCLYNLKSWWANDDLQVQRVEKEDQIFSFEVTQLQIHEFSVNNSSGFPGRCGFWDWNECTIFSFARFWSVGSVVNVVWPSGFFFFFFLSSRPVTLGYEAVSKLRSRL